MEKTEKGANKGWLGPPDQWVVQGQKASRGREEKMGKLLSLMVLQEHQANQVYEVQKVKKDQKAQLVKPFLVLKGLQETWDDLENLEDQDKLVKWDRWDLKVLTATVIIAQILVYHLGTDFKIQAIIKSIIIKL